MTRPPLRLVDAGRPAADEPVVRDDGRHADDPVLENGAEDADDEVSAEPAAPALSPRYVIAATLAFQLIGALSYLGKYVELTVGGEISPAAAILSVPASLALYAATLLLVLRPGRGRVLFIVAAVGLGIAVPFWGIGYGWTWPIALGATLALAGAWFARPAPGTPEDGDEPPGGLVIPLHGEPDDRP